MQQYSPSPDSRDGTDDIVMPIHTDEDIVRLRRTVRDCLISVGFGTVDQTKMVTAASELARNTLRYGGGGESRIAKITDGNRRGVSLSFHDKGPGIPDIDLALTDGYTTGGGMGLGLSGARRLSDEFILESSPQSGTMVKIVKWKLF